MAAWRKEPSKSGPKATRVSGTQANTSVIPTNETGTVLLLNEGSQMAARTARPGLRGA